MAYLGIAVAYLCHSVASHKQTLGLHDPIEKYLILTTEVQILK